MMLREDFYIGFAHYTVRWDGKIGNHVLIQWVEDGWDDDYQEPSYTGVVIFVGHYDKCIAEFRRLVVEYTESLF